MKIVIMGNAGSGKSTLTRQLAEARGLPVLGLDAIAFANGPERRPRADSVAELTRFVDRPWEPDTFATPEDQRAMLEPLIAWVRDYETRSDEFGLQRHRRIFERFAGDKREHVTRANPVWRQVPGCAVATHLTESALNREIQSAVALLDGRADHVTARCYLGDLGFVKCDRAGMP